jgi:hypothetical protein
METRDGFILGIFNYCDRWCERCTLSGRCSVFAEEQRMMFGAQPGSESGAGAFPATPLQSLRPRSAGAAAPFDCGQPDESADLELDEAALRLAEPVLTAEETDLHRRVSELGRRLSTWLVPEGRASEPAVVDAAEVVLHFGFFIGPKVHRALTGRAGIAEDGPRSDALGSAKAAILALDRIGEAWLRLAELGAIGLVQAAPVLTELQQLTAALDRLFPRARSFVRPGFDEPAAVAMLEWSERG